MKKKSIISNVLIIAFVIAFGVVCFITSDGIKSPVGTLWSLFPPVVAIGLALITKEVYSSLFIGIAVAGILASNFSFNGTLDVIVGEGLISAVSGTLYSFSVNHWGSRLSGGTSHVFIQK